MKSFSFSKQSNSGLWLLDKEFFFSWKTRLINGKISWKYYYLFIYLFIGESMKWVGWREFVLFWPKLSKWSEHFLCISLSISTFAWFFYPPLLDLDLAAATTTHQPPAGPTPSAILYCFTHLLLLPPIFS